MNVNIVTIINECSIVYMITILGLSGWIFRSVVWAILNIVLVFRGVTLDYKIKNHLVVEIFIVISWLGYISTKVNIK